MASVIKPVSVSVEFSQLMDGGFQLQPIFTRQPQYLRKRSKGARVDHAEGAVAVASNCIVILLEEPHIVVLKLFADSGIENIRRQHRYFKITFNQYIKECFAETLPS